MNHHIFAVADVKVTQSQRARSLSVGIPMVGCPGCVDQPANAQKAQAMGVALQVRGASQPLQCGRVPSGHFTKLLNITVLEEVKHHLQSLNLP